MDGLIGILIRFGQWLNGDGFKDYEHAFIYIGGGQIVEAEPGGARIADVTEYGASDVLWSTGRVVLSDDERSAVVEAARGFVGVPYSFLDYLLLALKRIHITVPILNRRVIGSKHMICSQLVAEAYSIAGVDLCAVPSYEVTPADLANLLEN